MIRNVVLAVASLLVAHATNSPSIIIDDFEPVTGWKAVPSDGVDLKISDDDGNVGRSMRLDFDFHGHGGYAVVHKDFNIDLTQNYEFSFYLRGNAPINNLEFKLIDQTGDNVWWSNQRDFVFPHDWKIISRKKRHITFAWGPLGGGEMKKVAAIEFAITAGSGGKGTVWIDELQITPLDPDAPYLLKPNVTASSSDPDHPPSAAIDRDPTTSWRSTPMLPSKSLDIDFLKRREFGGVVIDWEPGHRPASYIITGSNEVGSRLLYTVNRTFVGRQFLLRDYVYLPETDVRTLSFIFAPPPVDFTPGYAVVGIREIQIKPLDWAPSTNDFFRHVASESKPGSYPKYFSEQQSYWTVLGVDRDTREALINEQGVIETGKSEFSIEPFLSESHRVFTWHDAVTTVGSVNGDMPIKSVDWKLPDLSLNITAFAAGAPESSFVYARYHVRNLTSAPREVTLHLAIRPFQVNPPWQFLNTPGGVSSIDSITYRDRTVTVNGNRRVIPLYPPSAFGAVSFDEGNIVEMLAHDAFPYNDEVHDDFGHASALMDFTLDLKENAESTVDVAIPLHKLGLPRQALSTSSNRPGAWVTRQLAQTTAEWQRKLNRVRIELPASASRITESIRSNLAYILINRDGPGIQPGSRSYERSWIRDGSLTSTALLRLGHYDEVRDYINWYSKFQFDNGKIPCCVDSRGADPVPENDSHGEFIYLIAEYYRHTHDRALLVQMWPHVTRAWTFMDSLRQSRRTPEYLKPDKLDFYGLMPQSISHEGYSAKPMHSYWDDFFALRGFKDAAEIARILGKPEVTRFASARDEFRQDFYLSITRSMATHHIDYIPGAADLGDFDATSTTIALEPADELDRLPSAAIRRTFDKYYENFVARRDGKLEWDAYTPYEWRVVGSFIRLGQKKRAYEAVDFFFLGQRPQAWRQWAEVVYRNPKTPRFIGDMPHTWVGSDFIRSTLDMFSYERESDSSLVIGAGILESWAREEPGVSIRDLSTHYGRLSYSMRARGDSVMVRIGGPGIPPGGLIVHSPIDRPIRSASVNGRRIVSKPTEVVLRSLPALLVIRH